MKKKTVKTPFQQIAVSYGGRHPQLRWKLWFVVRRYKAS